MINRKYLIASVVIVATLVIGMVYGISQGISHASPTLAIAVEKIVVVDSFSYDVAGVVYGGGVRVYSDDWYSPNYGCFVASFGFAPKSDFQEITDIRINVIWGSELGEVYRVKFCFNGLTDMSQSVLYADAYGATVVSDGLDYSKIMEGLNELTVEYEENGQSGMLWIYRLEILIEYNYFR